MLYHTNHRHATPHKNRPTHHTRSSSAKTMVGQGAGFRLLGWLQDFWADSCTDASGLQVGVGMRGFWPVTWWDQDCNV